MCATYRELYRDYGDFYQVIEFFENCRSAVRDLGRKFRSIGLFQRLILAMGSFLPVFLATGSHV